jgi:nucleoside-diphosphate-sugar epimerase
MKILVTGANGFVGSALCEELFRQGIFVRAALRSTNFKVSANEVVSVGSIDDGTDWSSALDKIDVVIHLAARAHVLNDDNGAASSAKYNDVNVLGTLNLANQALQHGVKRFIFMSTIKVLGEQTVLGKPFTEDNIPNPQDNYGRSKLEAENGLLTIAQHSNMEVVIIRPVLIYGPGVKANFANLLKSIQSGFPLPFGLIQNKRSLIYLGNLVSLVLHCISHPAAVNQTFHASDDHDVSTPELMQACAIALGVKLRLLPVPQTWLLLMARLVGKQTLANRLCGSLQVDNKKARHLLGWQANISLAEGLKATVFSLRSFLLG